MSRKDMLGAVTVKELKGVAGDLMEKCSGRDGRKWLVAAKRFLRGEDPWSRPWKVSLQSDLGVLFDLDQIFEQIGRFRLTEAAELAIRGPGSSFRMGPGNLVQRVRFVELTPRDLGFKETVSVDRLVENAAENGLVPCPPEIALHLPNRASPHDFDRPLHVVSQAVVVAMQLSDGHRTYYPYRFTIATENDMPCLQASFMPQYGPDDRVLFALPDFATRWRVTLGGRGEMESLDRLVTSCAPGLLMIYPGALMALGPQCGFKVADELTETDLVAVSVGELGFLTQAAYKQVLDRAEAFGLEPCPAEVAPALALQECGRFLAAGGEDKARYLIVTEQDEGTPIVLVLEDQSLDARWSTDGLFIRPDDVLVFMKPRKPEGESEKR